MEATEKASVDEVLRLVARLALFVVDEVEPTSEDVLEADLESLYDFLVAVERRARQWSESHRTA